MMRPMMHTYEADNLIGLRIDDGRLELIAVLGHGAEGDVLLARNVAPPGLSGVYRDELYAVKVVSKLGIDGRAFLNLQDEIALHQRACADNHPGILTLHNVIDLPNTLYLVTSFAPSGDLFERIVNPLRPRLCTQPETVRSIIIQLIEAVEYLHNEKGIAHRDIKPENLFWAEEQVEMHHNDAYDGIERGRLFIGDFGLATEDRLAADFGSGTSFYTSPEAAGYFRRMGLNGGGSGSCAIGGALLSPIHLMTDAKSGLAIPSPAEIGKTFEWENRISYDTFTSDIWSIGIVFINLICERNPWQCALQIDETFRAYSRDPENTLIAVLPSLSDECHELLKKVLKVNPRERISLQEFRQEMCKIREFVRHSVEDIIIDDVEQCQTSWLDVGPRESTPGSSSPASQGPSFGSMSGWYTSEAGSDRCKIGQGTSSLSSFNTNSVSAKSANSDRGPETGPGLATSAKPKRPLPVPLQIDPYRLSAALSGHLSASLASARYAAYARPGSAIPCPVQMPSTAPIIRLTAAQVHPNKQSGQQAPASPSQEKVNNVVKLKMPPTPAGMRARQQQQREEQENKALSPTSMKMDVVEVKGIKTGPSAPLCPPAAVESLVASVPCMLSLSGSTDQSSEAGIVTPVDQTGPYVPFKGESDYSRQKREQVDDDDAEDGEDQWLTIKPRHEHAQGYLNNQHGSGYPPVTPMEGQLSGNVPPLTPLLLTPTSGRRYHPYGGNPYSGQALINSPLRMAQQDFLERHYGQQSPHGRDYLNPGYNGRSSYYAGGPRRGSVPEARMNISSRVNGDLMARLAPAGRKQ